VPRPSDSGSAFARRSSSARGRRTTPLIARNRYPLRARLQRCSPGPQPDPNRSGAFRP
jgi:hypothetical protein